MPKPKHFTFKVLLAIGLLLWLSNPIYANHIVGGELSYECLGGNQFRVNLTIYRDCNCTNCAPFDNPAALYLQDANENYLRYPNMQSPFRIPITLEVEDVNPIPINDEGLCTDYIPDVCVESAVYSTTLNLQPRPGGYFLVYQRCCRNNTIVNINSPGETGSTYRLFIPHENPNSGCDNSSPVFNNFPPIVICDGYPIYFDHSATDADGDSLVYELCHPFDGAEPECPGNPTTDAVGTYIAPCFCNPDSSPNSDLCNELDAIDNIPYEIGLVSWASIYGTDDPLGNPNDPLMIDPVTGLLQGTPNAGVSGNQSRQYVVGICVSEYRDGVLLSRNIRDFQFNVTACDLTRAIPDADALEISPGVFQIVNCNETLVTFDNASFNATSFEWDFGIEGIDTDVSTETNPMYQYPDTGTYTIQLVASNGSICVDTAILILGLYPTFEPRFFYDTQLCEGEEYSFNDDTETTYGMVNGWSWDFGDGTVISIGDGPIVDILNTTGTYQNPIHVYEDAGMYEVTMTSTNNLDCIDEITHTVEVYPLPNPEIGHDLLCQDLPINFMGEVSDNANNIVSWEWNFDNGPTLNGQNQVQTYTTPGSYSAELTIETNLGCRKTTEFNFEIYEPITADAGMADPMCFMTSTFLDASGSLGGAGSTVNSYLWEPSEYVLDNSEIAMPIVSPPQDQIFQVFVSDPNGCTDSSEVFVEVLPLPDIDAGSDIPDLCFEDSTRQLDPFIPTDVVSFNWTPNEHLSSDAIANPFVYPPDTSIYTLYAIDNNNCENTDSVLVVVIPPLDPNLSDEELMACEGDEIQLNVTGGMEFEWHPPLGLDDPNIGNPTLTVSGDESYIVYVSNPPCFIDSIIFYIYANPLPFVDAGDSTTINIGESTELSGMAEYDYIWSPSSTINDTSIANPIAMPLSTTYYTLTSISPENCIGKDSVKVTVENNFDIFMPSAFSPNGDGLHDDIGFRSLGIETLEEFSIFNRWGQKVFSTNDLNGRWDGTFNGKDQAIGVYVYHIRAIKFLSGEFSTKGNLTLIR